MSDFVKRRKSGTFPTTRPKRDPETASVVIWTEGCSWDVETADSTAIGNGRSDFSAGGGGNEAVSIDVVIATTQTNTDVTSSR